MQSIATWWMWLIFFLVICTMLSIDFINLNTRKTTFHSFKPALFWSLLWIFMSLLFNFLLWTYLTYVVESPKANTKALEFFTGYVLEKSLSIDNIFVFILIFDYFRIPLAYQHRVLLNGLLGAIIMRLILIVFGIYLVNTFSWIYYIFGALLVLTGVRMLYFNKEKPDLKNNFFLRWMRKHLRITETLHKEKFFIRKNLLLYATPLFLVLILVEISDLIFAVDSIPAVFAVTNDPFIAFTSNIFAILGLRSLYFLFAPLADRLRYLNVGIALVIIFIGIKMVLAHWYHLNILFTLGVMFIIVLTAVLASLWHKKK